MALLNDSKYGYAIHDDVIRLSLLRGTTWPDPAADEGHHEFAYALLPHSGTAAVADVAAEAHAFNVPLRLQPADGPTEETSWFRVDPGKLVLDTVKRAEDSPALVLRLYEPYGRRGRVRLSSTLPVSEARRANLLEDDGQRLNWKNGGVNLDFRPFEIITLKLSL